MSDNDTIGKAAVEYTDNRKHLACVRKDLADMGKALSKLGEALQSQPERIAVKNGRITVTMYNPIVPAQHDETIPTLDAAWLEAQLHDLQRTTHERGSLEKTLRDLGLGDLVRPD